MTLRKEKKSYTRDVATFALAFAILWFVGSQSLVHASVTINPNPLSECSDLIDNDSDGFIDFVPVVGSDGNGPDPDCENIFDESEGAGSPAISECQNALDDDGDGFVDSSDPNCHTDGNPTNSDSYNSNGSESGDLPVCWNGIDDDGDGFTDWAPLEGGDPGCSTPTDGNEVDDPVPPPSEVENTLTLCTDLIDNDGDDLIDLADPNCSSFRPTLTVTKVVINDNTGTSTVNDFPLFVGTTPVTSSATTTFTPGTYSVSETSNSAYAASFSGNCDVTGNITLVPGDVKICTITNNDVPPTSPLPAACADGTDNDGDGLTDSADAGCTDATDNDESNPPPSSGGSGPTSEESTTPPPSGGGGNGPLGALGGGGGGIGLSASIGAVLGVSAEQCSSYLTGYIHYGRKNDREQVLRLQRFLRDIEGFTAVTETGIYDNASLAAVHTFQKKYASTILTPWGATRSTGFVYHTTRKAINEIYCNFTKDFSLTADQLAEIARIKALGDAYQPPSLTTPQMPAVSTKPDAPEEINAPTASSGKAESPTESAGDSALNKDSLWSKIWNRIFKR
ncbi:MAG: hypothetical protein A3C06_04205 [Candidatus Taylorbacteria bacterium RIFCSPHIGHO2_02_FULL_46_13]|uniref:Peptidoglycan binding-like domain-containing protein n=1 Tax=Candidatus Taylorbacteria bacterium RIFCSPHIGHO2_02_FULL_46_13 TaxID=1802312 RepID=A0A1G2MTX8_9BACT|nr:MAG: hypothetical protein A3C06_04205 [Candidatus Taylorbacteria bacterium RIFCSPHIGHO2_02_FULL_46_13]